MGVVAAADLGDETAARDLVGEFSDELPGDVFGGHLDPKDVVTAAKVVHPASQRWSFNLVTVRAQRILLSKPRTKLIRLYPTQGCWRAGRNQPSSRACR